MYMHNYTTKIGLTILLISLAILISCAPLPAKTVGQHPKITPKSISIPPPIPQILATLTPLQPTPTAKPTDVIVRTADPGWLLLASEMRGKAQQALDEKLWEDTEFKEDAYTISNKMIRISTGKVKEDSAEILKRFRWGMEFMDPGQLQEVIKILDQYN